MSMPLTAIFIHLHSNKWLDIARYLVAESEKRGERVVLCDVSNISTPSGAVFSRFFMRREARHLKATFASKGHTWITIKPWRGIRDWVSPQTESFNDVMASLHLPLMSHMATFMRSQKPTHSITGKLIWKLSLMKLGFAYLSLSSFFENFNPDKVFVPSGRSPSTRLTGELAASWGSDVYWTEWDEIGAGLFLGRYRIHDRRSTLRAITEWKDRCDHKHEGAKTWIENRLVPGSHEFSSTFSVKVKDEFENIFLPSSPDEFLFLGDGWEDSSWSSQYEAFDAVLRKLDGTGEKSAIRMHPILPQKAFSQVRRELRGLRKLWAEHPDLTVIAPFSGVDTYALVSKAQRAFVSRSNLMLEAAFLGTPVWHTYNHICDAELDSRPLYSHESVSNADFSLSNGANRVNVDKNLCTLSFFLARARELSEWKSHPSVLREKRSFLLTFDSALFLLIVRSQQMNWINLPYIRASLSLQRFSNKLSRSASKSQ